MSPSFRSLGCLLTFCHCVVQYMYLVTDNLSPNVTTANVITAMRSQGHAGLDLGNSSVSVTLPAVLPSLTKKKKKIPLISNK